MDTVISGLIGTISSLNEGTLYSSKVVTYYKWEQSAKIQSYFLPFLGNNIKANNLLIVL